MKRLCLILIIVTIGWVISLNSLSWQLNVTGISQQQITADVFITNNTNNDVNWTFGDPLWITLMLDGHPYEYMVIQIVINVSIPAGSTRIEHLTYTELDMEPPQLISFGTHVLQACIESSGPGEENWVPVGNPEFIEVVNPALQIEYELVATNVTWQEISASLNITNNTNSSINWDHDYDFWVGLFMDDSECYSSIDPQPEYIQIPLGASFSLPLSYSPENVQATTGEHVLQAKRYNYEQQLWEPIGNSVTVTLSSPVSTDDAHILYTPLSAYPNPFNGNINIAYQAKKPAVTDIRIYNTKGQFINSYKATAKSGENTISWNGKDASGSNVPAGIYIINLIAGKISNTVKCIKIDN